MVHIIYIFFLYTHNNNIIFYFLQKYEKNNKKLVLAAISFSWGDVSVVFCFCGKIVRRELYKYKNEFSWRP